MTSVPGAAGYLLRLLRQVIRRAGADRIALMAAGLAFQSVLGFVPLVAVAFALLKAIGALDARSVMLEFLAGQMFPSASGEVMHRVATFADRIDVRTIGVGGLIVTLGVVFSTLNTIEGTFNHVWAAPRRRSLWLKLVVFYALTTLGTLFVALSLYVTATLWRDSRSLAFLMSSGATSAAFLLANKLLPTSRVRWSSALVGAGVSAIGFEAAKFAFGVYVVNVALSRYDRVYGALALVPLFFLWIYIGWLIVLGGAEIAHAMQRLPVLERTDRRRGADGAWERASGPLAARLLLDVAQSFAAGQRGADSASLCERHGVPEETVARILERLQSAGLILPVADAGGREAAGGAGTDPRWVLGRLPADIRLGEVLAQFRPAETDRVGDRLDSIWSELEQAEQERLRDVTVAALL